MDPPLQLARKKEQFCNKLIVQCLVLISSLFYTSYDVETCCIVTMFSYVNMKRCTSTAVFSLTICHSKNTSTSSLSKKLLADYGTTRPRGRVFNHNHNHFNHCGTPAVHLFIFFFFFGFHFQDNSCFYFHFYFQFCFYFHVPFKLCFMFHFSICFYFCFFLFCFLFSIFMFFFYFSMILMDHHTKL